MKISIKRTVVLLCLMALAPCAHAEMTIATTIEPFAEFIKSIAKEDVSVLVMIPPGAEPHTYEPTPSQLRAISRCDLYVKVGTAIEFERSYIPRLLAINSDMAVCDASEGIELIAPAYKRERHARVRGHNGADPHIWLSPANAEQIVRNIRDALIELDPASAEIYENNAASYIAELARCDSFITEKLEDLEKRSFMVYHPAWVYYAKEYDLKEIPIEREGKSPTPGTMKDVVDKAVEHDIRVIFISPQFSPKSARTVADAVNAEIVEIDPLAGDYIENLKRITGKIAGKAD